MSGPLDARSQKPCVAIVGAGFAGLRAAEVLLKHGCTVAIFEARNRVGGRLCQARVGPHLVDMGPNWVHGTQDNPVFELLKSTGTLTHNLPDDEITFAPNGTLLCEDEAEYLNDSSAEIDANLSLLDYIKQNVEEKVKDYLDDKIKGQDDEANVERLKDLVVKLAELWGGYTGATPCQQSLRFLWLEECLEEETLFCAGTHAKVLDIVSKAALDGADVKFGHIVNRICSRSQKGGKVTVETRDGGKEDFDEVVVTCPLGWLKKNTNMFQPELPPRISQAVANLGYGKLDKVYITFQQAWWEKMKEPSATAGPTAGSDSRLSQKVEKGHYPTYTTFITPNYAQETNPENLYQDCINLAALPKGTEHPTLLFYTSGSTSDYVAEIMSRSRSSSTSDTSSSPLAADLWQIFEPYVSRLPNYKAGQGDCIPVDILATGWTSDEFAGFGSYTGFPVGSTDCDKDIEALRDGVGLVERGVWLAGEHTAPFEFSATITGAYISGEKVAERILDAWSLKDKQ
ncbi:flavin-containing amine oxidoreductase [Aaosphaeria arxii CBS 175.79]|uniref:Flavin-containing amine oxidoreductase n=1 Tax=Aaosphaeria arxii CBS 175.79 TaxID=1450172 RepID=A0A6A5Y0H1_9PLEO|nr:flavin-containing amine oxidoreductase [Aaosphaeria arxii CBS 175.79]KAF2018577.1 flavin-containing amine oxidoreductase [Aaosphaeria arxii CBS 175.79]